MQWIETLRPYVQHAYTQAAPYIPADASIQNSLKGALGGQVVTIIAGERLGILSGLALAYYGERNPETLATTLALYILPSIVRKVAVQVLATAIIETSKICITLPSKAITWVFSGESKKDLEIKKQLIEIERLSKKILELKKEIEELQAKQKKPLDPTQPNTD